MGDNVFDIRSPSHRKSNITKMNQPVSDIRNLIEENKIHKRFHPKTVRKLEKTMKPIIQINKSYQSFTEVHVNKNKCENKVIFNTKIYKGDSPRNEATAGALIKNEKNLTFFTKVVERKQQNTLVLLRKGLKRLSNIGKSLIKTQSIEQNSLSLDLKTSIVNVWTSPYFEETHFG